jgi:hypothetical protein
MADILFDPGQDEVNAGRVDIKIVSRFGANDFDFA